MLRQNCSGGRANIRTDGNMRLPRYHTGSEKEPTAKGDKNRQTDDDGRNFERNRGEFSSFEDHTVGALTDYLRIDCNYILNNIMYHDARQSYVLIC